MANLAELQIQLELQTAAFEKGIKDLDRQLKKAEGSVNRTGRSIGKMEKTVARAGKALVAMAVAAATAFTVQQARDALRYADSIAKVADKVGVTVEELQQLRFAADQTGVPIRTLDMALQRFSRRTGEVANGSGELLKTWQELGLAIKDQEGNVRPLTELLADYADAIAGAGSQQEKLRLAFKAFDSEGAALVNTLEDGAEGLVELMQAAIDLGVVLDNETARKAEVLNDRLSILSQQLKTSFTKAMIDATEATLRFFGVFVDYDTATEKLAEVNEELRAYNEETQAIIDSGGRVGERRKVRSAELEAERAELEEQVKALKKYVKDSDDAIGDAGDGAGLAVDKYKLLETELNKLRDPFAVLQEKIDLIKEATFAYIETNGELGISLEDGATLAANLTKEYLETYDALVIYMNKVDEFAKKSNPFNEQAEQLGLLQAAYDQAMAEGDFGMADALFDLIADLSFAEEKSKDVTDSFKTMADEIKDAVDGFVSDFTNELVDGLLEGELAFEDFAKNVLSTLAKMMLNRVFTQFFDTVLGSFGFGSTGGTATTSISPDVTAPGARADGEYQPMVTGYSASGMPSLSGSNSAVTVNVINNGDNEVEVQEKQNSRGQIEIDVLIKQAVNRGIASGDFDGSMRSAYGTRRMAY